VSSGDAVSSGVQFQKTEMHSSSEASSHTYIHSFTYR
jgi:hypothetical protein